MKGFRAGADYQCWQDARERLLAVNHKIVHFDELAGLLLAFDRLAEALGIIRHAVGDVDAQANETLRKKQFIFLKYILRGVIT